MGVIQRQGIKNTIIGYAGIMIGFVSLIIIQPHFLTKEELGLTRVLFSFSMIISVFVPLGIEGTTLKMFPLFNNQEKKHHGFFAFMNLFPLVGFIITATILWMLKDFIMDQYRRESPLFLEYFNYVFPLIFINSFISVLSVYCQAHFRTTIPTFVNDIGVRVMTIILVSVYFVKLITLNVFIVLFCGIYAIQLITLFTYVMSFEKPSWKIDWTEIRKRNVFRMITYGLWLWFAGVAALGLKYFDAIMIGKYLPLAFVGIYTVASFIPTVIGAPASALEKIAVAKISNAWARNDKSQIEEIYKKSTLYLFVVGGILFLIVNVNIHSLLSLLPAGYIEGQTVVFIISIGTLFNMATGLNAPILLYSDKYKYGALFLVLLAVLLLISQMILIPRFGINGAAIGTSLSLIVYNSMLFSTVYLFFGFQPFTRQNIKVALVIVITFILALFLPALSHPIIDIAYKTAVVSTMYLFIIYKLKVVEEFHGYFSFSALSKLLKK